MASIAPPTWQERLQELERHRELHTPSFVEVAYNYLNKPVTERTSVGYTREHYNIMKERLALSTYLLHPPQPSTQKQLSSSLEEIAIADDGLYGVVVDLVKTGKLTQDEITEWELIHKMVKEVLTRPPIPKENIPQL